MPIFISSFAKKNLFELFQAQIKMTFANRTARVLGPYYEGEVPLGRLSISTLRQHMDWVGGFRKWPFLLSFSTVFMLT